MLRNIIRRKLMSTILIIILILLLLGALPVWPYSRSWGYSGSGIVGFLLLLVILGLLFGWF
jgi:hypothetical protein